MPTVSAPVEAGQPAASAACRAGACPTPAVSTQPMLTCSIAAGSTPARSIAARSATRPERRAPSATRGAPWKAPMGVRAALRMTTSLMS